jgi:hypothetical protein
MGRSSEQLLMEDLIIECLKIYGFEVYYMPRSEVNRDTIFTEDPLNMYKFAHSMEMYLQNISGFEGDGDLMTRFGVEIRDQATFIVSQRRWEELVGRTGTSVLSTRPAEGDIVFLPLTNSFFEIKRVESRDPFFQVGKLYVYRLDCELIQYSSERFDTGVEDIDIRGNAGTDMRGYELVFEDNIGALLLEDESHSLFILEDYDVDRIDGQSQNTDFETEAFGILDFSEKNPFGEVV